METRTITLADRDYEIAELSAKHNAAWRRRLDEILTPLLDTVQNAGTIRLDHRGDLTALIGRIRPLLFQSPELLTGLLFDYSPALARDRERIEADAYESELLGAFVQVLQLAYPFGGLFRLAANLNAGSAKTPMASTPTNSVSASGATPPG